MWAYHVFVNGLSTNMIPTPLRILTYIFLRLALLDKVMKTILFLHGFYASGSCVPANALRDEFAGRVRVLTPDLPLHPVKALDFIRQLCTNEKPLFLQYYTHAHHFPGGHTPTAEEVKLWYVPLIEKMLG